MSIKDIVNGHLNELGGKNESLAQQRMAICKGCPLLKEGSFGPQCNHSLWLNPATNETSTVAKEGFLRGCGCRLNAKTRLPEAKCPCGKW